MFTKHRGCSDLKRVCVDDNMDQWDYEILQEHISPVELMTSLDFGWDQYLRSVQMHVQRLWADPI